jgi:succinate-semialdehyde dehydrogenase/glutarate-semialdehyde dehydrogenase
MTLKAVNPATGDLVAEYEEMSADEASRAVDAALAAFLEWRRTSFAERARPMHKVADLLRERAREYGKLMAEEMGKPIKGGIAEDEKCAMAMRRQEMRRQN